jgi:hypothetical protein
MCLLCTCIYADPPEAFDLQQSVTIPINGRSGFIEDATKNPQLLSTSPGEIVATFQFGAPNARDRACYTCVRDSFTRTFKTAVPGTTQSERHFKCNMEMTCYPNSVVPESWFKVNQVAGQFAYSVQTSECNFPYGYEERWYKDGTVFPHTRKGEPLDGGFKPEAEILDIFVTKIGEWLRWKCGTSCEERAQEFEVFFDDSSPDVVDEVCGRRTASTMTVEGGGSKITEQQRADYRDPTRPEAVF